MRHRFVLIVDLDDEQYGDRRRDWIQLLGPEGRARSIHEAISRDMPGLSVQSVQEVATIDVTL